MPSGASLAVSCRRCSAVTCAIQFDVRRLAARRARRAAEGAGVSPWLNIAERMGSLQASREPMRHPARSAGNGQFRARFQKLVWQWRLRSGWFSQEVRADLRPAGRAVRDNSGDPGGWRAPSETSAEQAADIRASIARSEENPRGSAPRESAT